MSITTSATALPEPATIHGHIAARMDRLPLTAVQWRLAILVTVTWGFIIFDTDGIGARLTRSGSGNRREAVLQRPGFMV